MNFDYSEEQQLLADSVRRFVCSRTTRSRRAGRSSRRPTAAARDVWRTFAEMGLLGLPLPADARRLRRRRGGPDERDGGVRRGAGGRAVPADADGADDCVARGGSAELRARSLPAVARGPHEARVRACRARRALRPRARRHDRDARRRRLAHRRAKSAVLHARRRPIRWWSRRAGAARHRPVRRRREGRRRGDRAYRTLDEMRAADIALAACACSAALHRHGRCACR